MDIYEFEKLMNKRKEYRNLDDKYKTPRFLMLFLKMYEFILNIPKEKIVVKGFLQSNFTLNFLRYIYYFLKAKNFYHWKERLYKLITEKHGATKFTTYELLYGQKAKEFFNERLEKYKNTCLEKYGVDNPAKSEEVKEKERHTCLEKYGVDHYNKTDESKQKHAKTCIKKYGSVCSLQNEKVREKTINTNLIKYGCENPMQCEEVKEKGRQTNLERYGKEYYSQTEEFKEKYSNTCIKRYGESNYSKTEECKNKVKNTCMKHYNCEYPMQSEEIREKSRKTNLERRGCEYPFQSEEVKEKIRNTNLERRGVDNPFKLSEYVFHSKIGDEFCINLYERLPEEWKDSTIFYKKSNKEYTLERNDQRYFYDFCIPEIKVIVEFDGLYWHGLQEEQKDVKGVPVEEIWKKDMEKQKLAEDAGFRVIRVRENEYRKNKKMCIEKVLNNIKEKVE